MNIKSYSNGPVNYSYSLNSKKWEFSIPEIGTTLLTPVPGRALMAAKVANILGGSVKRSKAIDGLARSLIVKLVNDN